VAGIEIEFHGELWIATANGISGQVLQLGERVGCICKPFRLPLLSQTVCNHLS
jgi:hypothetical protein